MPVNSLRTTTIVFTGDVNNTVTEISSNSNSPGAIDLVTLSPGQTTITVPTGGSIPTAVTIVKPPGNTVPITLEGASGIGGLLLHLTNYDTITLDPTITSFILETPSGEGGAPLVGLRLIWS